MVHLEQRRQRGRWRRCRPTTGAPSTAWPTAGRRPRLPADLPSGAAPARGPGRGPRRRRGAAGRAHGGAAAAGLDRAWGWTVQLYAVHSAGSWGHGDYADLTEPGALERGAGRRSAAGQPAARRHARCRRCSPRRTTRPRGASAPRCTCVWRTPPSTAWPATRCGPRSRRCGRRGWPSRSTATRVGGEGGGAGPAPPGGRGRRGPAGPAGAVPGRAGRGPGAVRAVLRAGRGARRAVAGVAGRRCTTRRPRRSTGRGPSSPTG